MEKTQRIPIQPHCASLPEPDSDKPQWHQTLTRIVREKPEETWGGRMIRFASDMMIVCNQDFEILYHNRAFLRGLGHSEGTYVGHSFIDFFPTADKGDALQALNSLVEGNTAGLRIEASILTRDASKNIEARVTRTRRRDDTIYLYFVIRDVSGRDHEMRALATNSVEAVFEGLPMAAFRTDRELQVTQAFGALWKELGVNPVHMRGAQLVEKQCHLTPGFLHEIDYCDAMAGLTYHGNVTWRDRNLEITIEPFVDLDKRGRIMGTIGIIREAKTAPNMEASSHLDYPEAEEYTKPLKIPRTFQSQIPVEIGDVDQIRAAIQPRPMRPGSGAAIEEVALAK